MIVGMLTSKTTRVDMGKEAIMANIWTRRSVLSTMAVGASGFIPAPGFAQGAGLLERLRKAGVAKVGITNGPPYSELKPDGTLDGVAPTITGLIMKRLGVPKLEGVVSTYGALIPGLQAGRWDFISAALTITKVRCEQVAYSDPFLIDSSGFAYVPADLPDVPKSIKEIGEKIDRVGMLTSTAMLPLVQAAVNSGRKGTISQFPDNSALLEALFTKRVQVIFSGILILKEQRTARNNSFEIVYPLPDDFVHGSGPAFRPGDTDLIEAFQTEFRKMKKSGEAQQIIKSFGFTVQGDGEDLTAEQACQRVA